MNITRTRTMTFRPANYESLTIAATVEFDPGEEQLDTPEEAADFADTLLDALLQADIDRADETSKTPEDETYVHAWKDSL